MRNLLQAKLPPRYGGAAAAEAKMAAKQLLGCCPGCSRGEPQTTLPVDTQAAVLGMLHSFFLNIPKELDESAMVDGCTRFQAFRHVIVPVMWPGVITTGLFSFLLAYNDFTVTATLLSQANQTMVPRIASFLGTTQTEGNVMFAVAAVVSATAPLFVLVLFFQRQIVSGLTAGAVKG